MVKIYERSYNNFTLRVKYLFYTKIYVILRYNLKSKIF